MKPYPGTQSALRAVRLLKAFRGAPELTLGDLSRIAALNKTTAYRLLTALQSEGMVARSTDGERYRVGPELLALGGRSFGAPDLRLAARAELEALAHATQETVTLEILAGREVLILEEIMGRYVVGAMASAGTRWPAHATSTGKVLLAHLPKLRREEVLSPPLAAPTPRTVTDPVALERELARVRARGFALSQEELEPGFVAVGAPVRAASGEVVAAVSAGGPKARLSAERVAEMTLRVPAAAARVSARLGWTAASRGAGSVKGLSRKARRR
jgi:IclR family transcriptional regulator, acetate operon repressor